MHTYPHTYTRIHNTLDTKKLPGNRNCSIHLLIHSSKLSLKTVLGFELIHIYINTHIYIYIVSIKQCYHVKYIEFNISPIYIYIHLCLFTRCCIGSHW